ncbi:alpha/beta hydrolase, partial [Nocardia africana]
EQALAKLTPLRDRLAETLGVDPAAIDGAEGMRHLGTAATDARLALARALGDDPPRARDDDATRDPAVPVSGITPATAREVLGEAISRQLLEESTGTQADRADDVAAAASLYLATTALLDLVTEIHRRSPNSCVNNGVTAMRVLCEGNADRFTMPSGGIPLRGHSWDTVQASFRGGTATSSLSLDEAVASLKNRPGGAQVLVYKWKNTEKQGSGDADNHLVVLVNDSEPGEEPNLVVVDLAASRDGRTDDDFDAMDLADRRTLLNKAVKFDKWRREQQKFLDRLPESEHLFRTIDFDADGDLVTGAAVRDMPPEETLNQPVPVDEGLRDQVEEALAGAREPVLSGSKPSDTPAPREVPRMPDELPAALGEDVLGRIAPADRDPAIARDAKKFVIECYRDYKRRGQSEYSAALSARRVVVDIERLAEKRDVEVPDLLADLYRAGATAATWEEVWKNRRAARSGGVGSRPHSDTDATGIDLDGAIGSSPLDELDYTAIAPMIRGYQWSTDPALGEICKQRGFDGLPEVAGAAELDALIAAGGRQFFRGVRASEHVELFRSGPYFPGRWQGADHGNGTYVTTSRKSALEYADDSPQRVLRMVMRPESLARAVDFSRVRAEQRAELDAIDAELEDLAARPRLPEVLAREEYLGHRRAVLADTGRFAAAMGYPGYHAVDPGGHYGEVWVILDRTSVTVDEVPHVPAPAPRPTAPKVTEPIMRAPGEISRIIAGLTDPQTPKTDSAEQERDEARHAPLRPDPARATREELAHWAIRLPDDALRSHLAEAHDETSARLVAVRRGQPPSVEAAVGTARVQVALAAEQWRRIVRGGSRSATAVAAAATDVFDLLGAVGESGMLSATDGFDVLGRFPERVAAAAELDTRRIVDAADWARIADERLVACRGGGWDPDLMRALRELPSRATAFAAALPGSDQVFGEAVRRYVPDAYRAALHFLTRTSDTERAVALLRDLDQAVAAAADRLGPASPAMAAGLSLYRLRMDVHQAIVAAGGATASAMRAAALQGLAENPALERVVQRVVDEFGVVARRGSEPARPVRPYTAHRIAAEDLFEDDDEQYPAGRPRALGVRVGTFVEPSGASLQPVRTGWRGVSFVMDRWGRMMAGDDHDALLRLMSAMGDELAGWGTLATDDSGRPDGPVRPYRVDEIFDPMGTAQLRDVLARGGLRLDDSAFDNESQGKLWRGDPPPVPELFDMEAIGFDGSVEALFAGYGDQFWVKADRERITLSRNEILLPLTLAPLRRTPGRVEIVVSRQGERVTVRYRDPDPGTEPEQVAPVFAELHRRMTRWVAESGTVDWHPDTDEVVRTFEQHLVPAQPEQDSTHIGGRPTDSTPDPGDPARPSTWPNPAEVKPFGPWLRAAREALGISQKELAARMGIPGSASYLGSFERGIRPTRDMMLRIFEALAVPEDIAEAVLRESAIAEIDKLPDPTDPMFAIPNAWIVAARLRRKLTQRELAAHVGLSVAQWAPRERATLARTRAFQITREQAQRALEALEATEQVADAFMRRFYPETTATDNGATPGRIGGRPSEETAALAWHGVAPVVVAAELTAKWPRLERVSGFDHPGADPESLREIARAIDDLYTRYPHINIREVRVVDPSELPNKDRAGRTVPTTYRDGRPGSIIKINAHRLLDADRYREMREEFVRSGLHRRGSESRPFYRLIQHEGGHALDYARPYSHLVLADLLDTYLNHTDRGLPFLTWLDTGPEKLTGYSYLPNVRGRRSVHPSEAGAEAFWAGEAEELSPHSPLGTLYRLASGRKRIDYQPLGFARNMMRAYWPTPDPGVSVAEMSVDIGSNHLRVVGEQSTPGGSWRIAPANGVFPAHDVLAKALPHLRAESLAELNSAIVRALGAESAAPRSGDARPGDGLIGQRPSEEASHPFRILDDPGMSGDREVEPGYWGHYGAAGVLVRHVNGDGDEVFLICRSKTGFSQGNWQLPGGALCERETPAQGAAREMNEELGADAEYLAGLAHWGTHVIGGPRGWKYHVLVADAPGRFDPVADGEETAEARWVTRAELAALAGRGELHSALARHLPRVLGLFDPEADVPAVPTAAEPETFAVERPDRPAYRVLDQAMFDDYVQLKTFGESSFDDPTRLPEVRRRNEQFFETYPQARESAVFGQLVQYERVRRYTNEMARELGTSVGRLNETLTRELTDLVEGKPLAIRMRQEALFGLLADGRFKTQFEGMLGGGRAGEVARLEDRWFGNPEDVDPRLRPVYGLVLIDGERPAGLSDAATSAGLGDLRTRLYTEKVAMYGRIEVVLRDDVRQRATFCVGDSLVYSGSQFDGKPARTVPSPLLDPRPESFGVVPLSADVAVEDHALRGIERDYSGALFRRHQFVESHIHGGVTLADIDHINLPESPDPELRAALDNAGIPWRVLDSHAVARSGDAEAIARERHRLEEDRAMVEDRVAGLRREIDAAGWPGAPSRIRERVEAVRVELRNAEAMRDRIDDMLAPLDPGSSERIGSRPSDEAGDGTRLGATFRDDLPDGLSLTVRETEVFAQARNGLTHTDIAVALDMSEHAVRASLGAVRRKLAQRRQRLVAQSRLADPYANSESGRFRSAMGAALIGADAPDPRRLIAEASAEQLERLVSPVRSAREKTRGTMLRAMTLLAAQRSVQSLADEYQRSQAELAAALAQASPADLQAALDELDPVERRILLGQFGPETSPATFEPEDSVRGSRAVDIVRRLAASIADRAGASAEGPAIDLLTAVQQTNHAIALTYTTDECVTAVAELGDRRDPERTAEHESASWRSLPADHGFDEEQRRIADEALRAGGFHSADGLQRRHSRRHPASAQRRATENAEWWDSLRDPAAPGGLSAAQRALIQVYPHEIGNADGLPAVIRDHANRLSIRRQLDEFVARKPAGTGMLDWVRTTLTAAERKRFDNLVHVRNHLRQMDLRAAETPGGPPVHLLFFDAAAFHGKGKAVAALGNVDTAHTVNWHVPGTNTTSASLAYQFAPLHNLYHETLRVEPSLELASIIWIGYDAPAGPVNTGFVKAAFRRRARVGGERLACDIAALHAGRRRAGTADPDRLVNRLYGHSYGSVTLSYAGRDGGLAGLVDSVILAGSPGAGPIRHAEEFGIGADNVYVFASWRDVVTKFGADEPGAHSRYHHRVGHGIDPATEAFGAVRLAAEFPNSSHFAGVEAVHQGYLHYDPETGLPNEALDHAAHITAGHGGTRERVAYRRAGARPFAGPADPEQLRYAELGPDGDTEDSGDPDGGIGSRPHDEGRQGTPWSPPPTATDPNTAPDETDPAARLAVARHVAERRADLLRELSDLLAPPGIDPAELLRTGSPTWEAWFTRYRETRRDLAGMLEIERGAAVDDQWLRHVLDDWREQDCATPEILAAGREFERMLPIAKLVDDIQRLDTWARTVEAVEAELARRAAELSGLIGRAHGLLRAATDFRAHGELVRVLGATLAAADRAAAQWQRLERHARALFTLGTAVAEDERTSFEPWNRRILEAARHYRVSSLDSWHGMTLLCARLRSLEAAARVPGHELSPDIEELRLLADRAKAAVERYDRTHLLNADLDAALDLANRVLTGVPAATDGATWQLSQFPEFALFADRLAAVRDDVAHRRQRIVLALRDDPRGEDEIARASARLGRLDTVTAALDEAAYRRSLGRVKLIRRMNEHLRRYPLDRRMDRGALEPELAIVLEACRVSAAALPDDGWAQWSPAQVRRHVDEWRRDGKPAQLVQQGERYLSLRLLAEAFEGDNPWNSWYLRLLEHAPALNQLIRGRIRAEEQRATAYSGLRELATSGEVDLSRWRSLPELREALHRTVKEELRWLTSVLGAETPEALRGLIEAPGDTVSVPAVQAAVVEVFPLLAARRPEDLAVRDRADHCLVLTTMVQAAEQIDDGTTELDKFDADLDDWLDEVMDTVGRAGGPAIEPDEQGGTIGARPSDEHGDFEHGAAGVFSPGMSAAEVRAAVAGAWTDPEGTPAELSPELTKVAALLVDYALQVSGRDGVRITSTTTSTGPGYTVGGSVEGLYVPASYKPLVDVWGGEMFGDFDWADPGDGTAPSWSVRLWGDRKRFKRLSAALPAQLAGSIPGFPAQQTLSALTEAVRVASTRMGVGRGGGLGIEARDGRLRVRVGDGAAFLLGTPGTYEQTIDAGGPQGLSDSIGSRPHDEGSHDEVFGPGGTEDRIGSTPFDDSGEIPPIERIERLRGRPGVRMDRLTYADGYRTIRETYDDVWEAIAKWTDALIARCVGAPVGDMRMRPPEYHVLYRDWTVISARGVPGAADRLGIYEAITGKRTSLAEVFVRREGRRTVWRDHHIPRETIVDIGWQLSALGDLLWQLPFPDTVVNAALKSQSDAMDALREIAAHAGNPLFAIGLDDAARAKTRLVETFKLKHPYVEIAGFDTPYVLEGAVEQILGKLDELLEKYRYAPGFRKLMTNIRVLWIDFLISARAVADPRRIRKADPIEGSELTFSLRWAGDRDLAEREARGDISWGACTTPERPYADVAVHEFVHAIDQATQYELSGNLLTVLRAAHSKLRQLGLYESFFDEWLAQLPSHAYSTRLTEDWARREALAVGFTDAEIGGTRVGTPQWVIHEYVTNHRPPQIDWNTRLGAAVNYSDPIGSRPAEIVVDADGRDRPPLGGESMGVRGGDYPDGLIGARPSSGEAEGSPRQLEHTHAWWSGLPDDVLPPNQEAADFAARHGYTWSQATMVWEYRDELGALPGIPTAARRKANEWAAQSATSPDARLITALPGIPESGVPAPAETLRHAEFTTGEYEFVLGEDPEWADKVVYLALDRAADPVSEYFVTAAELAQRIRRLTPGLRVSVVAWRRGPEGDDAESQHARGLLLRRQILADTHYRRLVNPTPADLTVVAAGAGCLAATATGLSRADGLHGVVLADPRPGVGSLVETDAGAPVRILSSEPTGEWLSAGAAAALFRAASPGESSAQARERGKANSAVASEFVHPEWDSADWARLPELLGDVDGMAANVRSGINDAKISRVMRSEGPDSVAALVADAVTMSRIWAGRHDLVLPHTYSADISDPDRADVTLSFGDLGTQLPLPAELADLLPSGRPARKVLTFVFDVTDDPATLTAQAVAAAARFAWARHRYGSRQVAMLAHLRFRRSGADDTESPEEPARRLVRGLDALQGSRKRPATLWVEGSGQTGPIVAEMIRADADEPPERAAVAAAHDDSVVSDDPGARLAELLPELWQWELRYRETAERLDRELAGDLSVARRTALRRRRDHAADLARGIAAAVTRYVEAQQLHEGAKSRTPAESLSGATGPADLARHNALVTELIRASREHHNLAHRLMVLHDAHTALAALEAFHDHRLPTDPLLPLDCSDPEIHAMAAAPDPVHDDRTGPEPERLDRAFGDPDATGLFPLPFGLAEDPAHGHPDRMRWLRMRQFLADLRLGEHGLSEDALFSHIEAHHTALRRLRTVLRDHFDYPAAPDGPEDLIGSRPSQDYELSWRAEMLLAAGALGVDPGFAAPDTSGRRQLERRRDGDLLEFSRERRAAGDPRLTGDPDAVLTVEEMETTLAQLDSDPLATAQQHAVGRRWRNARRLLTATDELAQPTGTAPPSDILDQMATVIEVWRAATGADSYREADRAAFHPEYVRMSFSEVDADTCRTLLHRYDEIDRALRALGYAWNQGRDGSGSAAVLDAFTGGVWQHVLGRLEPATLHTLPAAIDTVATALRPFVFGLDELPMASLRAYALLDLERRFLDKLVPGLRARADRPEGSPAVSRGESGEPGQDGTPATGHIGSRPSSVDLGSIGARPWPERVAAGWHPSDDRDARSRGRGGAPDIGWLTSVLGPLARHFDVSGDRAALADRAEDTLTTDLLPLWHHLGALAAEFENRNLGHWYERTMLDLTGRIVSTPIARYRNLYAAAPGDVDDRYCPVGARGEVDLSGKLLGVFMTGPSTPSGGAMFEDVWRELGDIVHGIAGYWARERFGLTGNLDSFNAAVRSGLSPEDAARTATFTGKMAHRRGFTEVVIDVLEGEPGNYDRVELTYVRPGRLREVRCHTLGHQAGVRYPELLNRAGWSAEIARLREHAARELRSKRRVAAGAGLSAEAWASAAAATEARIGIIERLAEETARWWAEQDARDHAAVATVAADLLRRHPGAVRVAPGVVLLPGHTVAVIAEEGLHDDALTDMLLRNLTLRAGLRSAGYAVLELKPVVQQDNWGNTHVWAEELGRPRNGSEGLIGGRPSENADGPHRPTRWAMSAAEQALQDLGHGVEERIPAGMNESFAVDFGGGRIGVYRPGSGESRQVVDDDYEDVFLVPPSGLAPRIVATSRLDEMLTRIAAESDSALSAGQVPTATLWSGNRGPGVLIAGEPDLETPPQSAESDQVRRDLALVRRYILGELQNPEDATYVTRGPGDAVLAVGNGTCLPDGPYAFSTVVRELPDGSRTRHPEGAPRYFRHALERGDARLHPVALAVVDAVPPAWLDDMLTTLGIERSAIDGALARLREMANSGRVTGEAWPYSPETVDDFEIPAHYLPRETSINGARHMAEQVVPTRNAYDMVPLDADARAVEHIPRGVQPSFLLEVVNGRFVGPDGMPYTSPLLPEVGIRDAISLVMGPNIGDAYRAGRNHLDLYDHFPRSESGVPGYAVSSFVEGTPQYVEPFANAFGHSMDGQGERVFDARKMLRAAAQLRHDLRARGVDLSYHRFHDEIRGDLWRAPANAPTVADLIDGGAEAAEQLLPGLGAGDFWVAIEGLRSEPDRLTATLSLNPVLFEPGEVELEWRRGDGRTTARLTRVDLGADPVRVAETVRELDATVRRWLATSGIELAGGATRPADLTVRDANRGGRTLGAGQVVDWVSERLRAADWADDRVQAVAGALAELATRPGDPDHVRVELSAFGEPGSRILLGRTIETHVAQPEWARCGIRTPAARSPSTKREPGRCRSTMSTRWPPR